MSRVCIDVIALEFEEGGQTLWITGPEGGTALRIKCTGKITSQACETSPVVHCDAIVQGDIVVCIPKPGEAEA